MSHHVVGGDEFVEVDCYKNGALKDRNILFILKCFSNCVLRMAVSDDLEQMWKESFLRQATTATFAWGTRTKLREISSTITGLQTNNRTLELPDTKQHFYPMNCVAIIGNRLGRRG